MSRPRCACTPTCQHPPAAESAYATGHENNIINRKRKRSRKRQAKAGKKEA